LWAARKGAFGAVGRATRSYVTQDGVVPRSQIAAILKAIKEIGAKHNVTIANVFHAGDGNMHPCIWYDERDTTMLPRVLEAGEEILRHCIDLGGSVTGEHGVGIEKINLMEYAFSPDTLSAMHDLRAVFNPDNTFNPSKVLPSKRGCIETNRFYEYSKESTDSGMSFLRRAAAV
jgi:glycolate oxidase